MTKVHYDQTTGEILGFYPDDIGYVTIPEPFIEIDETAHQDCIKNSGKRRVDVTTKKIITYTPPEPTAAEIKKKNLQDLVDAYNVDVSAIRSKLVTYIAEGEAANADKITAERANLTSRKAQYTSDRAAILKS